jgi:hypothetical protein
MVTPVPTPVVLKPAPFVVTPEIVMSEFPLFVSVTPSELLTFRLMLPKLRVVGLAPRSKVEVDAVPVKGIVMGEPGALLEIEMAPVSVPAAVGLNVAVNVALPPAAIVVDCDMPEALKAVPEADAPETVTLALPVFFRVIVCELVVPVEMVPNGTLVGVADSVPCAPVPDKATATVEFEASLVTVILPLELTAEVGLNCVVNEVLCPAPRVSGVDKPV